MAPLRGLALPAVLVALASTLPEAASFAPPGAPLHRSTTDLATGPACRASPVSPRLAPPRRGVQSWGLRGGALGLQSTSTFSAVGWEEGDEHTFDTGPALLVPQERYTSGEWFWNLVTVVKAPTLYRIASHLFANVLIAALIYLLWTLFPGHAGLVGLTAVPHSLLGAALGLLLVFRTNSAYDRFWEARKIWGQMIGRVRLLAHFAQRSLSGLDREHYLVLMAALPPLLLQHLRGWRGIDYKEQYDILVGLTGRENGKILFKVSNRPLMVCKMMSAIVHGSFNDVEGIKKARKLSDEPTPMQMAVLQSDLVSQRKEHDNQMGQLYDCVGASERIVKTTVPVSYSRHTSRFLSVWCFTLPLVLVESLGWRMIPAVAVVAWALFTIEEVGHVIEDPFNIPMRNQQDSMKLERSFQGLREDIMLRTPGVGSDVEVDGGDSIIANDYDYMGFHKDFVRTSGFSVKLAQETCKHAVYEKVTRVL